MITEEKNNSLERSCAKTRSERIKTGFIGDVEYIEVSIQNVQYAMHRHDTYTLAASLRGVPKFYYRGTERFCSLGEVIVLHPDERHDGGTGSDEVLNYKAINLPPSLIAACSNNPGLPFVNEPVVRDRAFRLALLDILSDTDSPSIGLKLDDFISETFRFLARQTDSYAAVKNVIDTVAARRAAEYLREHLFENISSENLEQVTGVDRYEISRHFKSVYGTSPHRFLILRRLEHSKRLLFSGASIANVAAIAGFSDQPHFTNHFKKAYGLTPAKWLSLRHHKGI